MEHGQRFFKEVGLMLQVEPNQAVAFQAQTVGAKGIFPGVYAPVGQKLPAMMVANRANDARTSVKEPEGFQAYSREALQILARHEPHEPGDDFFHEAQR